MANKVRFGSDLDADAAYRALGHLLATVPDFSQRPLSNETHQWLGRAYALVQQVGEVADIVAMRDICAIFQAPASEVQARWALDRMMAILYRALAIADLKASPGEAGRFIPAGNRLQAFTALARVLGEAAKDALIVDPYFDGAALTDFAGAVPERVSLRILAGSQQPTLKPAAARWATQYPTHPLEVRLAPPRSLHDRYIFIDGAKAWVLSQSLKDFANRSPAEIIRADDDMTESRFGYYEEVWRNAKPLA